MTSPTRAVSIPAPLRCRAPPNLATKSGVDGASLPTRGSRANRPAPSLRRDRALRASRPIERVQPRGLSAAAAQREIVPRRARAPRVVALTARTKTIPDQRLTDDFSFERFGQWKAQQSFGRWLTSSRGTAAGFGVVRANRRADTGPSGLTIDSGAPTDSRGRSRTDRYWLDSVSATTAIRRPACVQITSSPGRARRTTPIVFRRVARRIDHPQRLRRRV